MKGVSFTFWFFWLGQLVSTVGTELTSFVLGVEVYKRTGHVTEFALVMVLGQLPQILFSPIAGVLVDRWTPRLALIAADAVALVAAAALMLLAARGQISVPFIWAETAIAAACQSIRFPALAALTVRLVPGEQRTRANGLLETAVAASQLLAPASAGVLLSVVGLLPILTLDVLSYLIAIVTLLPRSGSDAPPSLVTREPPLAALTYGVRYVLAHAGLRKLLFFTAGSRLSLMVAELLITPLVLSFASAKALGLVLSIGGLGMLAGSVTISVWGGPRRPVLAVLFFTGTQCVPLLLGGLRASVPLIAAAAFVLLFTLPIASACSQSVWQAHVPPDVQGRVFAARTMVVMTMSPIGALLAGPLADGLFEPLMSPTGPLASSVGQALGVGPGRGIALCFVCMGFLVLLLSIAAYAQRDLRALNE